MAHRAGKASTKLGRDSKPKYLGIKLFDGQKVKPGTIIVLQRGTRYMPGVGCKLGNNDTIYAATTGSIKFRTTKKTRFDGSKRVVKVINII